MSLFAAARRCAAGVGVWVGVWMAQSLTGCAASPRDGYSFAAAYDPTIQTVAVPIFANATFYTGLENDITDAVIKQIQRETPWRVSQSEGANAVLSGQVTSVRLVQLSTATGIGLVQEQGVEVTAAFDLVDNRTGETLVSRRSFTALASFVPAQPTGELLSVGLRGAAEQLASDIVSELATSW